MADVRRALSGESIAAEPVVREPSEVAEVTPAPESIAADPDPAETKDAQSTEETPEKKSGIEKRFSKLTKTIRDLEARLAATPVKPEVQQEAAKPESVKSGAPKQEDFSNWEDFSDALVEYKVEQIEAKKAKAHSDRVAQAAQAAAESQWENQTTAAAEKHDDFDAVALNSKLPVSPVMFHVIQSSENGAELLYHLGSNPEVSAKIAAMTPGQAALALGKLEAKLFPDEAPKPVAAPVAKALPKPPATVGGTATAPKADISDPNLPFSEFKKQLAKLRKQ